MISLRTHSPQGTEAVGEAVAGLVTPGDVVLLLGALGSGKTTFVRGLARGLGYGGAVTSPTFTLCHNYSGRQVDLLHADLWRLERVNEVLDLALEEETDRGAALVVEWGEAAPPQLADRALLISFELPEDTEGAGASDLERCLSIEARGPWADRDAELSRSLSGVGT